MGWRSVCRGGEEQKGKEEKRKGKGSKEREERKDRENEKKEREKEGEKEIGVPKVRTCRNSSDQEVKSVYSTRATLKEVGILPTLVYFPP